MSENKTVAYLLYSHVDNYEMPYLEGCYEELYDVVVDMNDLHMINVDYCGFNYYSLRENKFFSVVELRLGKGRKDIETYIGDITFSDSHKTPLKNFFDNK